MDGTGNIQLLYFWITGTVPLEYWNLVPLGHWNLVPLEHLNLVPVEHWNLVPQLKVLEIYLTKQYDTRLQYTTV